MDFKRLRELAVGEDTKALEAYVTQEMETDVTAMYDVRVGPLVSNKKDLEKDLEGYRKIGKREDLRNQATRITDLERALKAAEAEGSETAIAKAAEELAAEQITAEKLKFEENLREAHVERDGSKEKLENLSAKLGKLELRNDLLPVAQKIGLRPELTDEFMLRMELCCSRDEHGNFLTTDPRTGMKLPGSGHEGHRTPQEVAQAFKEDKGSQKWDSGSAPFFLDKASGGGLDPSPQIPVGETAIPTSQAEFEKQFSSFATQSG